MSTLLHLNAGPRNDPSHSRRLSAFFGQKWLERHPSDTMLYRDLRIFTPPHVTEDWIAAAFSPPDQRSPQMRQALQISDLLIDEFGSAHVYVFGVPMSNVAIPSLFKAYIDNIVRVERTFPYVPGDSVAPYKGLVYISEIAPGATVPTRYHPGHELAYLLEGSLTLEVGDTNHIP